MSKSGPKCGACKHEKRAEIELALINRVPSRVIAANYGLNYQTIRRHGLNHLDAASRAAMMKALRPGAIDVEAVRKELSTGLLAHITAQIARLHQQGARAMAVGDYRAAAAIEGRLTSVLELFAKLDGQLVQRHEVTRTSILVHPDWLRLRVALLRALEHFHDAKLAVAAALAEIERDAAQEIQAAVGAPPLLEAQAVDVTGAAA